jgi:hypothetical protein
MLNQVHLAWARFKLTMLVVIGTDCIGSYISNYHTIMATTAPNKNRSCLKMLCIMVSYILYVYIIWNIVSSNPAQARCTWFNIMR